MESTPQVCARRGIYQRVQVTLTRETLDHLLVHSRRAQRYALALVRAIDPTLLEDRSLGYGFILHDVGKIGIPDWILLKPASLTDEERG